MRNTIFQPRQTLITAEWLNAVDETVFSLKQTASLANYTLSNTGTIDESDILRQAILDVQNSTVVGTIATLDLAGLTIGIGSTIVMPSGVFLKNGKLVAVGTWTATNPLISFTNTEYGGLYNVQIDCQLKCAGVLRSTAKRNYIKDCFVKSFLTYGVKDTGTTQEAQLMGGKIQQYSFSDSNKDSGTAPALWVDTNDSFYTNVTLAYSSIPLYITGSANLFSQIHAYGGNSNNRTTNPIIAQLTSTSNNNTFVNCYWDSGTVQMVDSFKHYFVNDFFYKTDSFVTKGFELVTSVASVRAQQFIVIGAHFNTTYSGGELVFSTTGSGSWFSNPGHTWIGCKAGTSVAGGYVQSQGDYLTQTTTDFSIGNGAGTQYSTLNGAGGFYRAIRLRTNGSTRWVFGANTTAESGSNAGSDFALLSYDDTGTLLQTPFKVYRATGQLSLGAEAGSGTRVRMNTDSVTSATTGAATALPANPQGYIVVNINGTDRKIPYYV